MNATAAGKRMVGPAEDPGLWAAAECAASRVAGRSVRVAALERQPSPFASLFPAEVVTVWLDDGDRRSFFVKHRGAEQADHPDKGCRERETRIYEELLGWEGLPVPGYYGSYPHEQTGRELLFLEYVDDWSLKYHDLDHWYAAARRLAELHRHFALQAERLSTCGFLLLLDSSYFTAWSERALREVARMAPDLTERLAPLVERYGLVAELLARQPQTLVHNDLAPKNVLADRSTKPARIRLVDWEMAGVGCGLLDLVHLKHGLTGEAERRLCRTYGSALGGAGLLPSEPAELDRLYAACELHQTLFRLASARSWGLPLQTVAQWVEEAWAFGERAWR